MSKGRYIDVEPGVWETIGRAMDLQCCDCRLVHTIYYRAKVIDGKAHLQWNISRNNRATAALRRKKKK